MVRRLALPLIVCLVALGTAASAPAAATPPAPSPPAQTTTSAADSGSAQDCAASTAAADLDAFFSSDTAAGLAGADYPHAYALPDGRTLWMFQDAFLGTNRNLAKNTFAHNAAMVQDGACFRILPTPGGTGTSFIGSWSVHDLSSWVWPLDAEIGNDGYLWVFLAEVQNPTGDGAAIGARPIGTWRARLSLPGLKLVDMQKATQASGDLFGYSIVSDARWTYLYGHCYRQFRAKDAGFDPACSPYAWVARVPLGELDHKLEYWSADGWTSDRSKREAVLTAEQSMPVSVERFGDTYVAVSDENDWFGTDVVIRTSTRAQGPFTEVARYTPPTRCVTCNNYGAFVLPHLEGDRVVIAQSNNAWNMAEAIADGSLYRINVRAVDVPGVSAARADLPAPLGDPPTTTTTTSTTSTAAPTTEASSTAAPARDPIHGQMQLFDDGRRGSAVTAAIVTVPLVLGTALMAAVSGRVLRSSRRRRRLAVHRARRRRAGLAGHVHLGDDVAAGTAETHAVDPRVDVPAR